jgi:O-antigen/teichoic acid export membrane protein
VSMNEVPAIEKQLLSPVWQPVIKSAKAGAINKILVVAIRLITIPLLINHLGTQRYGLWMTFASFSAYVMIFDLGISMALINRLTNLYTASDRDNADGCISSSLIFLSMIALCCMLVSLAVIPAIDWGVTLKLSSRVVVEQASSSLTIILLLFFLQLPSSVILKVPYTMQIGWLSEIYQMAGTVISLLGTVIGVYAGADLPVLVLFLACSPVIAACGLLVQLVLSGKLHLFLPSFQDFKRHVSCLKEGSLDFMLMQAVALLTYSLQFTLLAIYRGVEEVAQYGLITQVLIALQIPFTVVQQPMWTRMTQLVYERDFALIKKMIIKYLAYACGYSLAATVFMLFLVNPILALILHKPILLPFGLRMGFAIACTLGLLAGGGIGTVLLALNLSRPMALLALGQLIIFLGCVFSLVPAFGAIAMISSANATYIISIPAAYWLIRKRLWRYDGICS